MRKIVPAEASDTENGITLSIVQAEFSSSETRLLLEVAGLAKNVSYKQFSLGTTLVLRNAEWAGLPTYTESAPPSEQGNPRGLYAFGPVADVTEPVELTVVYALESPDAVAADSTWKLSFVPGKEAADPIDIFLEPNKLIDYGQMTISVRGVHISSSQISVYYDISLPEWATAAPVMDAAQLVYADGQVVLGETRPEFSEILDDGSMKTINNDPLANASHAISFPLRRSPTEPFEIKFGQFSLTNPLKRELTIPVDEKTNRISSGADVFDLTVSIDAPGAIVLHAQRLGGAGPGSFLAGTLDETVLRDDVGNTYSFVRGENGFRRSPETEPVADRTILVFAGPIDKNAQQLYLALPDVVHVLEPVSEIGVLIQ